VGARFPRTSAFGLWQAIAGLPPVTERDATARQVALPVELRALVRVASRPRRCAASRSGVELDPRTRQRRAAPPGAATAQL